jgi:hypothetical protein
VGPAGLEPATSWFVAVNTIVDPARLTGLGADLESRHLDPILDPPFERCASDVDFDARLAPTLLLFTHHALFGPAHRWQL